MPAWRKIAGAALIIVGVLALVTPLTPGSWLIFVGAELLGVQMLSRENLRALAKKVWPGYAPLVLAASAVLAGVLAFLGYWLAFQPAL
jgi:hypothetical protein